MTPVLPPAPSPCASCPYRRDAPPGLWARDEYDKLPEYDRETFAQPPQVFLCHTDPARLCAGWTAVHDLRHSLGFRIACGRGMIAAEQIDAILDYQTATALFESGAQAAAHGVAQLDRPPRRTRRMASLIRRKLKARSR